MITDPTSQGKPRLEAKFQLHARHAIFLTQQKWMEAGQLLVLYGRFIPTLARARDARPKLV